MDRLIIGCGYLGQRVAARWVAAGDAVYALTRKEENAERLAALGVTPLMGDVLLPETLLQLPEVDTVLWAVAWDRSAGYSQHDVYISGLENVLQQIDGRCGRLLAISSTSVFGQSAGEWVDETSPCVPPQPNGQVCLMAEGLVRSRRRNDVHSTAYGTVLRLSGIYGPGRLLSKVNHLRDGEPLAGEPDAWLNLIHVDDAAAAVIAAASMNAPGSLLLISDQEPVRRYVYYSHLAELVGAPPPRFDAQAAPTGARVRPAGLNKRCSNALALRTLPWTLQFPSYREGLAQATRSMTVDGF